MNEEIYMKKNYTIIDSNGNYIKRNYYDSDKIFDMYSGIYFDMWRNNEYDSNGCIYERYGCKINKGDVVLDIGANIGMFMNRAIYDGASKVIGFEPLTPAFRCLIENKPDNCEIFKIGLSDTEGIETINIPINFENLGGSSINHIYKHDTICYTERIYLNTLNNLYDKGIINHIDFIKIDCEGHEYKVIQGLSDLTLEKMGVSKISMEFHNVLGRKIMEHIINRFVLLGFNFFILEGSNNIITMWK
jgi:FkbM family methyltransferase